ncbi:methyltransferase domain-containing protein [Bacillus sp. DTU_2020_1000418_1_SI_GHA_SEK_038]|uniref:TRM11 family SAM-dependent methyltransferase n=1 Tax=Bacillus sp. DTU_2020_1000418_1_SI_GHA_SEK_038 TaxID=3077585 RepID=UPI0028E210D4|nr:methyltransferase domain-containing protein [Bacillus sp. DTU_2020_1000418_1_SI_GHA_SEK_038]WNS75420.1 methyltransferase domain-containing protein [Bacillus sp. DTU_2020_1000418_1_SI_GHA_SEK_038]
MVVSKYIYTYNCYEEERSLCALEMRSLFGIEPQFGIVESNIKIDPSRSPFMKERVSVMYTADSLDHLLEQVSALQVMGETFKVIYVKNGAPSKTEKAGFENRRSVERKIGLHINGVADLHHPDRLFGVIVVNGRWIFGDYVEGEPVWFRHQQKPHSYSTALNTRVARAIVNIAIPNPTGIKAIDPCCGIGTVLVEALSMGIDIVGSDRNPLVLGGARENIAHFGLSGEVKLADIRDIKNQYDVAIIDLPYNLCSVITQEEKTEMLQSARRFAKRVVVVTVEPIDEILVNTGFVMIDRAVVRKGSFSREVIVCK